MISELVTIEHYFGRIEAVMTLEDLVRRFGRDAVSKAIANDQIEVRCTLCRVYALLTDRARESVRPVLRNDAPVPVV